MAFGSSGSVLVTNVSPVKPASNRIMSPIVRKLIQLPDRQLEYLAALHTFRNIRIPRTTILAVFDERKSIVLEEFTIRIT